MRIELADPDSEPARRMIDALWSEIQQRYEFEAPNPMDVTDFHRPGGAFWLALDGDEPAGSVGLIPRERYAELDAMYVVPTSRRSGVARRLMQAVEEHAVSAGWPTIKLRAGTPQPEALAFYETCGFTRIEAFGHWRDDPTAVCFAKSIG